MCLLIWTVFSGERCGPWASCYALEIEDRLLFFSYLSLHNSEIHSETLTLLITFEKWDSFDISHGYSLWQNLSVNTNSFYLVILTLEFDIFFWKLKSAATFLSVSYSFNVSHEYSLWQDLSVSTTSLTSDLDHGVWPIFWKM